MRNMLDEFYKFLAQTIVSYFLILEESKELQNAESFCLKLDDEAMVKGVDKAIKEEIKNKHIDKVTEIQCLLGDTYYATTASLSADKELIIASQIDGMLNDFLGATLRNKAKEMNKSILMISDSLIDSASSGSRDMTASGMPLYYKNLIEKIKKSTEESSQLNHVEKKIIEFELNRRNEDAFNDKDSFYEYADLLTVLAEGKIDNNVYKSFRLFPIKAKSEYSTYNDKQIEQSLKQNNILFERISTSIKFSSIEKDFSKEFEDSFLKKMNKKIKEDPEDWSSEFYYSDLLIEKEKKEKKLKDPLLIEISDIEIFDNETPFSLIQDQDYIVRKDGKHTGKKRKYSIIAFNVNQAETIYVRIGCKTNVRSLNVTSSMRSEYKKCDGKIVFEYSFNGVLYEKVVIEDKNNSIKYEFNICILNIASQYLIETIRYNSLVNAKKKCIKLSNINSDVIFNESANYVITKKILENEEYSCKLDQKLVLKIDDKELIDYEYGTPISVDFGGIRASFLLFPDASGIEEITGRRLLREKYSKKKSFTYTGNMHMHRDSNEYYAKGDLLKELKCEKQIVENFIVSGKIKNLNDSEEIFIEDRNLEISESVKSAYIEFLSEIQKHKSLPSLVYLKDGLLEKAKNYVDSFKNCYEGLMSGVSLTLEQINTAWIGSIVIGKNDEVWLSPLHPLNVAYQLSLINEFGFEDALDIIVDKLRSTNLFPYLKIGEKNYKVSDKSSSLEWNYYAPLENKKYRGSRKFISNLVEGKIVEYVSHFKYLFDEINNYHLKINVINMGDCGEVFQGIAQYYMHYVKTNPNYDNLLKIEIHVYGETFSTNKFLCLKNYDDLKQFLKEMKISIPKGTSMISLEGVLSKSLSCYFHEDTGSDYEYAHMSFYEMESKIMSGYAVMKDLETGTSLGGLLSGIPSSKYGTDYRTGFGSQYSDPVSPLIGMAKRINSIAQTGGTSNPYNESYCISTQVDQSAIEKMEYIYRKSNWVVFVEPKVDLSFFMEKEKKGELLIIHYSDQFTTSSGYDALTITHKSDQYIKVIEEQLTQKGIDCKEHDAASLINIFNSINGDWLLRLVSSISGKKTGTYFDREKISIAAGIKLMLAYLKNKDLLWVPISLEEMLRVSGASTLSSKERVLSAKNLGFENGPTSDDLLFVGLDFNADKPRVYLYPVEVKTGNNSSTVIEKAILQATSTARGLRESFAQSSTEQSSITQKIQRNFLMQVVITSCKKMKIYRIDEDSNWDLVINDYRKELLNDEFDISTDINEFLGNAAVLSFKKQSQDRQTSFQEEGINVLEFAESDEYGLILKTVSEITDELKNSKNENFKLIADVEISSLTGDMSKIQVTSPCKLPLDDITDTKVGDVDGLEVSDNEEFSSIPEHNVEVVNTKEDVLDEENIEEEMGIKVNFGVDQQTGSPVIWEPNNTDVLSHMNTGIIGTMGTGKTQFTKSLITQLYRERDKNIGDEELGILIFDYKGDYNESKEDFVKATNAQVYKPYHLPINPFAILKPKVFKPLLPIHVASSFRDTLCKIYNLGPKQQNTIFNCIKQAYEERGIVFADPSTWDKLPPSFRDVYRIYEEDEEIKKGDSLSSVLSDINNFQLFEPDPSKAKSLSDLLHGVVVIDLNGYDSKMQNLIVAITLDLFFSNMQAEGSSVLEGKNRQYRQLKKMILVDEADNFMSEDFPSLNKIMKEGREYGVGVVLSTQSLKHFTTDGGDYSKYILTWVVHNVSDLKKNEIDYIFRTEPKSEESHKLFNDVGRLEKHYSLVKMGNGKPVYMLDKAFWQLYKELIN